MVISFAAKGKLFGPSRLWRFADMAVGSGCVDDRFQIYRPITFRLEAGILILKKLMRS